MKSLCTPDSYEVLCRSVSLRVDRAPKLQSDSSECEYRMLPFHTRVRKWKSKATVRSDADSPGHCETVVGIQQCGVWSLLSRERGTQWLPDSGGASAIFEDKGTLKFPSGIRLWKLSIGLLQNAQTL